MLDDSFNQLNGIPGATGRFLAFWATFINAAFSNLGIEIVALAAAEAENPHCNVPRAIRQVFYRVLLFYVGGVVIIGLLVPYHNSRLLGASTAASSPFVIAIENAKIKILPSIINTAIFDFCVFSWKLPRICSIPYLVWSRMYWPSTRIPLHLYQEWFTFLVCVHHM